MPPNTALSGLPLLGAAYRDVRPIPGRERRD
jgi:hypothetical protein